MAFWKRDKNPRARLTELIGECELPSFPNTVVDALGLLREEGTRIEQIAAALRADPGMNVRILRTVNSAAFGMVNRVTNMEHAVTLLGRSRVEALLLVVAVQDRLPSASSLDAERFWRTSALRAYLATAIGTRLEPEAVGEAFTSAFLQDMAIPVLFEAVGDDYADLYNEWIANPEGALHECEHSALGYDHAMVGAIMAETWELPDTLIEAIADHHVDGGRGNEEIHAVATLHDNDLQSSLTALGTWTERRLQLEPESVAEMIATAQEEARSIASTLSAGK